MDTSRSHAYSSTFLSELEHVIENEISSRSVMLGACRKLSEHFGTCIFFNVHKKNLSGFVSAANGEETAYATSIKISFEESSEFSLAAQHHMPSQGTEISAVSWHNFLQMRGLSSPRCFSVLPLMVSGRSPSVFYTDSEEPLGPADSALLLSALNAIGRRLEELIVKKKLESGQYEMSQAQSLEEPGEFPLQSEEHENISFSVEEEASETETLVNADTEFEDMPVPEPSGVIITSDSCPTDYSEIKAVDIPAKDESPESSWAAMFKVAAQDRESRRKKIVLPRISELEPEKLEEVAQTTTSSEVESTREEIAVEQSEETIAATEETAAAEVEDAASIETPACDEVVVEPHATQAVVEHSCEEEIAAEAEVEAETLPEPAVESETEAETELVIIGEASEEAAVETEETPVDKSEIASVEEKIEKSAAEETDLTEASEITPEEMQQTAEAESAEFAAKEETAVIENVITAENIESSLTEDFSTDEDTSIVVIDEIKQSMDAPQTEIENGYIPSEDTAIVVLDLLEDESAATETEEDSPIDDIIDTEEFGGAEDNIQLEDLRSDNTPESWEDVAISESPHDSETEAAVYEQEQTSEEPSTIESDEKAIAEETDSHESVMSEQESEQNEISADNANTDSQEETVASETEQSGNITDEVIPLTDYLAAADKIDPDTSDMEDTKVIPASIETNEDIHTIEESAENKPIEVTAEDLQDKEQEADAAPLTDSSAEPALSEEQPSAIEEAPQIAEESSAPSEQIETQPTVEENIEQEQTTAVNMEEPQTQTEQEPAAEAEPGEETKQEEIAPHSDEQHTAELTTETTVESEADKTDISHEEKEAEDKGWHLSQHHPVPIHQFPQLDQINGGDEILSLIQQGEAGVKFLQTKLLSEDSRERFKGVIGFAYYYYPPAVKFIADLLFDPEAAVRDLVIRLLPYYREQGEFLIVQDILVKALRPDSKRLAEAVFLAGELRVRKAVPLLIGLLDIGTEKENYIRALQKITLQNLPAKSTKWKKWWTDNQGKDEVEWCLDALQEKDTILGRAALRYLERRAGKALGIYNLANRKERRKAWQDWKEWWEASKG